MQRSRRTFLAWLGLAGLLGALVGPAVAAADPLTDWTPGPGAILDDTYDGFIDVPQNNATVPLANLTVSGWFVDKTAQGWAGADDIEVWQGTMESGGKMLAKASIGLSRPDVAAAEGNPYFVNSGFGATVPAGALSAGSMSLLVYAHTGGKGWWYKQVNFTVSAAASTAPAAAPAASTAPASGTTAAVPSVHLPTGAIGPVLNSSALPYIAIEAPTTGQNLSGAGSGTIFTVIGFAVDTSATPNQGSQGSGIDSVTVYVDGEPNGGGTFIGNAGLAYSDPNAASAFGPQFIGAGWRQDFKPTNFADGSHQLYVYAHSVVSGKTNLALQQFTVVH